MEVAVGGSIIGHGPVDGQLVVIAHGDHGVAVLSVHQIQIGQLIGGIGEAVTDVVNGILAHGGVEGATVRHLIHQQLHAVGILLDGDFNLAVVDEVGHAVIVNGSNAVIDQVLASSSFGDLCGVRLRILIHDTAHGESAGLNLDVAGDGLFAYGKHGLDLALVQFTGIDGHGVGGGDSVFVHLKNGIAGNLIALAVREQQTDGRGIRNGFQGVDVTLRARGVDAHIVQRPGAGHQSFVSTHAVRKGELVAQIGAVVDAMITQPSHYISGQLNVIARLGQSAGLSAADDVSVFVRHAAVSSAAGIDGNVSGGDGDISCPDSLGVTARAAVLTAIYGNTIDDAAIVHVRFGNSVLIGNGSSVTTLDTRNGNRAVAHCGLLTVNADRSGHSFIQPHPVRHSYVG